MDKAKQEELGLDGMYEFVQITKKYVAEMEELGERRKELQHLMKNTEEFQRMKEQLHVMEQLLTVAMSMGVRRKEDAN